MASTSTSGISSQNAAAAQPEGLTLQSLPDVPLLHVLSYVPLQDLSAAGRAHPRLGELTRMHGPLWQHRRRCFANSEVKHKTIGELVDHLKFAPSFDTLVFDNACDCCCRDEFYKDWYWKEDGMHFPANFDSDYELDSHLDVGRVGGTTKLTVTCYQMSSIIFIDALAPMEFKSLKLVRYYVEMADLSYALRNAHSLETLTLEVRQFLGLWPQDLALPNLRSVDLDTCAKTFYNDYNDALPNLTESTIGAIGSFLRAHSGQLREVTLHEDGSSPVVLSETWPKDLDRLTMVAAPAVVEECLRERMLRLKELRVRLDYWGETEDNPAPTMRCESLSYSQQVQQRLGLQRLELWSCRPATVAALLAGGLHGLEALCVVLEECSPMLSPETFRDISAATIPALNLLVVRSLVFREGVTGVELDPVLKDLVHRAPEQSLHLIVQRPPVPKALDVWLMLFRHSPDKSDCSLCADAAATLRRLSRYGTIFRHGHTIERVQVL